MRWSGPRWRRVLAALVLALALIAALHWASVDDADPSLDTASRASGVDDDGAPGRGPAPGERDSSADTLAERTRAPARAERLAGAEPPPSQPAQASLDDAPRALVAARLDAAIRRAQEERGLRVSPGLVDLLLARGTVRVIVAQPRSRPPLGPRLAGTRHTPPEPFTAIPFVALEAGPQALATLVASPDVLGIELDREHRPGLVQTVPLISADAATAAGFDGSARVIAILDTGVDTSHPVFAGRVVDEACFSTGSDCPGGGTREFGPGTGAPCSFGCDHGTLVAGVALGLDTVGGRTGVAPAAGLISIMVYSDEAGGAVAYTSDIIAALEHVYALRAFHTIAAVNLSLGGDPFNSHAACDAANTARKAAIDLLRGAGIPTIASSGNDGFTDLLTEPACISTAISVGATTKADAVASFSNSASFLSLLAPGSLVETSRPGGGFAPTSGTSIAAPHVAGAWAAILEAVPGSNVSEVLFALQSTGRLRTDPRNAITKPRIDVAAAIEALDAGIDIEDPTTTGTGGGSGGGSTCGLVGLEALAVVGIAHALAALGRRRGAALPGR